jgi:hypothetical protein
VVTEVVYVLEGEGVLDAEVVTVVVSDVLAIEVAFVDSSDSTISICLTTKSAATNSHAAYLDEGLPLCNFRCDCISCV